MMQIARPLINEQKESNSKRLYSVRRFIGLTLEFPKHLPDSIHSTK